MRPAWRIMRGRILCELLRAGLRVVPRQRAAPVPAGMHVVCCPGLHIVRRAGVHDVLRPGRAGVYVCELLRSGVYVCELLCSGVFVRDVLRPGVRDLLLWHAVRGGPTGAECLAGPDVVAAVLMAVPVGCVKRTTRWLVRFTHLRRLLPQVQAALVDRVRDDLVGAGAAAVFGHV